MSAITLIPDVVRNQDIHSLSSVETATAAAKLMMEKDISAVLVYDDKSALIGIVTERDIARRVVAQEQDPKTVLLSDLMTRNVFSVLPTDSPTYALRKMVDKKCRHLPIVEQGRVLGMVSMRDLRISLSMMTGTRGRSLFSRFFG